jgi:hypothetical protein
MVHLHLGLPIGLIPSDCQKCYINFSVLMLAHCRPVSFISDRVSKSHLHLGLPVGLIPYDIPIFYINFSVLVLATCLIASSSLI